MADMVTVTSVSPSLLIAAPGLRVQFVDGEAEVPADQLAALRPYLRHGITLPDGEESEEPKGGTEESKPQPKTTRRRASASAKPFD